MNLLKRIGYYLGGFSIGLVILAFFFSGKRTSCAYFPEARVLKNMRSKVLFISPQAEQSASQIVLDSTDISLLLKNGDIDFDKSETRKEPCARYYLDGNDTRDRAIRLTLDNCADTLKVSQIEHSQDYK